MKTWFPRRLLLFAILASGHVSVAEERLSPDAEQALPISLVETGMVKDELRYVVDDNLPLWAKQLSDQESNELLRFPFGSLLLANVFARHSYAAKENELSISRTLAQAQFNTVQMPPEESLISKYGEGQTFVREGDVYHVYYLADSRLWLQCKSLGDDRLYKPVAEILISSIDLGANKVPPKAEVEAPNLKGIRVGDDVAKALKQWGKPLRKYPDQLGAKATTVFEFFPTTLVEGSCVRFFVRGRIIVGFAFSSEE